MEQPMNTVVMLDFDETFGDAQQQLLALAGRAQTQDTAVLVACPRSAPLAGAADLAEIPCLPLRGRYGHFLWLYPLLSRLKQPGVILHAHGWQAACAALLCRRFLPRLPLVLSFRGTWLLRHTPSFLAARQLRRLCAAARAICCPTRELAEVLKTFGAEDARIRLCPPLIPARPPCPEPADRFVFVASAPLEPDSGFSELLDAMAMVQGTEQLPSWELRIVGAGDQFADLLDKATQLGVESRLALLGDQDTDTQLDFAHVAVSCSRHSREQFMFLLRAWARRLPVLATGTPEILEFVTDRQDALVSQPANAVALGTNMVRCLSNHELRQRISLGGAERFAELQTISGHVYADLYSAEHTES